MTKPYENMKTEKRRAKVGEWVRGTITGREATVVKVEKKSIEAYYEGEDYSGVLIMPHENYEVIVPDSDTEALYKEIEILRNERDDARKKLKTLNDGIGDYRTRIERQEAAIQSLQDELKTANDDRESLELTLNEIRGHNADWQTENAKLRDNIHLLQNRLDNLREDHAASEDRLCERVGHERKLAYSLMDYIRGLEVGVK